MPAQLLDARDILTGERWEACTGLLFLRARYYEPEIGRFISKDPWLGDLRRPLTLQGWIYVQDNPSNAVDPSGWYAFQETHYERTRQWAFEIASGFAPLFDPGRIAEAIASGDRRTDTNARLNSFVCRDCHFCSPERTRAHINDAINSCNPYFFGHILHQAQDFYSHWNEGYHWEHMRHNYKHPRSQWALDDFFKGGHYVPYNGGDLWVESPFGPHPRDQVERVLAIRNGGLEVGDLSEDALIDLYLRDEPGTDPKYWEMRDYFEFGTDEYFEGSRRDSLMKMQTRLYIVRFMAHLVLNCCQVEWEDAVIQRAYEALTK